MRPRLKFDGRNELLIDYLEKTVALTLKSDQGPACTNTVEAVYLISVIFSIVTGIGVVRQKKNLDHSWTRMVIDHDSKSNLEPP